MKKCFNNLCLVMLNNCGHYCAEEKPHATKHMIKQFIDKNK